MRKCAFGRVSFNSLYPIIKSLINEIIQDLGRTISVLISLCSNLIQTQYVYEPKTDLPKARGKDAASRLSVSVSRK